MAELIDTFHFGRWDAWLIAVVIAQSTVVAYVHNPRWKGFVNSLPIPFCFAVMMVGRPVDATNALGLLPLLLFTHGVRWLHGLARLDILPSIARIGRIGCRLSGFSLRLAS